VFLALAETVRRRDVPAKPFHDLLRAFVQDQRVRRYPTYADLDGYCVNSANPVGRLVLYLCGYRDEERQRLSDFTCTALQLANFWQDVIVDYGKDRIYLPLEDLARFECTEEQIARREFTPAFRELMRFEVDRARGLFQQGLPLVKMVNPHLAADLDLFSRGGLEILNMIEEQDYNVLRERPSLGKFRKLRLLATAAVKRIALVGASARGRSGARDGAERSARSDQQ
jgi:squalene synthase HpnC